MPYKPYLWETKPKISKLFHHQQQVCIAINNFAQAEFPFVLIKVHVRMDAKGLVAQGGKNSVVSTKFKRNVCLNKFLCVDHGRTEK